jgi:thioredoxin 1
MRLNVKYACEQEANEMYTQLTTDNFRETIARTEQGIVLCSKKLCPHCKNMEKVIEKFSTQHQQAALFKLDSEEDPQAMADLGAERVPTILIIKKGAVAASKTGLMNPRELATLFDSAK